MEKIELSFWGRGSLDRISYPIYEVVLKMDENGKYASMEINDYDNCPDEIKEKCERSMPVELPKRVMKAFTESSISKILSKDEIPNESGMMVLDGYDYTIVISKGDLTKEYYADDCSIETYPLLRYLASWYRRERWDYEIRV